MTVYKYFLKITWKNKFAILLYIAVFFFTIVLSGSGVNETESSITDVRLNIGIIDNEESELSRALINYIESRNNIVDTREDEPFIKDQIFMEVADAVLIISEGFDEDAVLENESVILYTDESRPETLQIQNQINKYLSFSNISYEDGNYNLDLVNISVFSISILCLTFLITNLTNSRYTIMVLATTISLGTSFISGVMVPQEILGEKVLNIAKLFPTYYFVRANDTNINSYLDIRNELIAMGLFSVAFLLIGIIVSKRSLNVGVAKNKSK